MAFGYGIKHRNNMFFYFQDDPCPCRLPIASVEFFCSDQVVLLGPTNEQTGQYEYVVLSNWARFPIIGLARDAAFYHKHLADRLEKELASEGFINSRNGYEVWRLNISRMYGGSLAYVDWSQCRPATPLSYIGNVLRDLFG